MRAPLTPGFMVLQGNQLEDLRDLAVQWLANYPLEPLENECILVQSNGIAQWLKMALAENKQGFGIAAAVQVQLPGRFIWQAFRSVFPELPTHSPFDKGPLTWRIYRLLSQWSDLQKAVGEQIEAFAPLHEFLTIDQNPNRAYQLAAQLADLYDQYQLYRADWLAAWEQGQFLLTRPNGQAHPLPAGQHWQAILWSLLCRAIRQEQLSSAGPWDSASRAQIHQEFIRACAQFSATKRPANLPRRVIVFSISSLPKQSLELLKAISPFTQVMIFTSNPCAQYWGDLIEGKELLNQAYRRQQTQPQRQHLSPDALHAYGHPLLASWGKQGRDFLHLLDEHDQPEQYRELFAQQKIDLFTDPAPQPNQGVLLHQLQSDILNLRSLQERQALGALIDAQQDHSLQFIQAHSAQREVEILHDQLLASFAAAQAQGQPLQARDILVMVPDIDQYAPHIHAVFGRYAKLHSTSSTAQDPRFLPYHIADQGQRRHNTLLIALEQLLHLPQSRFTVSELSDLLDVPALRARFGLNEQDLPRLRRWIEGVNIRWGLDGKQRQTLGLTPGDFDQNTWLAGLQRMLLGFALGNGESWQGIEPYDEISGLDAALLGPLAQLLEHLQTAQQQLSMVRHAAQWPSLIESLLGQFFVETSSADSWALAQLEVQLETLHNTWQAAGLADTVLPLEVVRSELLAGLDEPNLTQKFLAGAVNFATLMPMRAIPFAQLWLLGMNDGDFPRSRPATDFDLMAREYRPGDRSRREDDRYLFLEALLSARERLVISWVGRDIRDNSLRPPSVLVSQLRDHLQAGWQAPAQQDLLDSLSTEHPLQPFSQRYFAVDRDPRLFTYAKEWQSALLADTTETQPELASEQHPWQPQAAITLTDLARFMRNPVAYFYQQRLGLYWQDNAQENLDSEPFAPDALTEWALTNDVLQATLIQLVHQPNAATAQLLDTQIDRLSRTGALPLAGFASRVQQTLRDKLNEPLALFQHLQQHYPLSQPTYRTTLSWQDLQLEDSLGDLRYNAQGDAVRLVLQASNLHSGKGYKYHHLVRQWPAHLFAQLKQPTTTYLLGPNTQLQLPPLAQAQAQQTLLRLLELYYAGMQQPLPLPCQTAFAYLQDASPQSVYEGGFQQRAEIDDTPGLRRDWPDYDSLFADPLFTQYAEALYGPLWETLQ